MRALWKIPRTWLSAGSLIVTSIGIPVVVFWSTFAPNQLSLSRGDQTLLVVLEFLVLYLLCRPDQPAQPQTLVRDAGVPLEEYIEHARDLFVSGGSLDLLIRRYGDLLAEKAKSGCNIRIVLMDPDSPAIPCVERWAGRAIPHGDYRRDINSSLGRLSRLDFAGNLEVRLNCTIPAVTVFIVDGARLRGKIRVTLQPFQCESNFRPALELRNYGENKTWYNLFYRLYAERLWEDAKPFDPCSQAAAVVE